MRFLNIQKNTWFGFGGETFDYSTFKQGCMGLNKLRLNSEIGPFFIPNSRAFATLDSAIQAQKQMIKKYDRETKIIISAYQSDYLNSQITKFLIPNSKTEYDYNRIKIITSGNIDGVIPNGKTQCFDFITVHQRSDLTVLYYETMDFSIGRNPNLIVKHSSQILPPDFAGTIYIVTPIRSHYRAPLWPRGVK